MNNPYNYVLAEQLVKKDNAISRTLIIIGCIIATPVLTDVVYSLAYSFISQNYAYIFGAVMFGLGVVGVIKAVQLTKIEFDYNFFNGEMELCKIVNQSERYKLISFTTKEIEVMGKFNEANSSYLDGKFAKIIDATSSPRAEGRWFIIVNKESGRALVSIEPSDEMIEAFRKYMNRRTMLDF